jgi:hypothetical protein
MMGVTMTVAITVWIASSLLEYRIVSAIPALRVLFHGLPGVLISILIGSMVAYILSAPAGAGVMLGQLLGLATNEFTFKTFSKMSALNQSRKVQQAKVQEFKTEHPQLFSHAVGTMRGGVKTIIAILLAVVYIVGIPMRVYQWCMSKAPKRIPAETPS